MQNPSFSASQAPELTEASLQALLNTEQFEAVMHAPGPQLILAGAGSGKTRVLTYKIAWLILEHKIRPHEILAVTFTNKAAQEMRNRVTDLLGYAASLKWMGTFHSVCARLLRFHAVRLEYTPHFTIFDTDDQKKHSKKIIQTMGLENDARFSLEALRRFVGQRKNEGVGPEEAARKAADPYEKTFADFYHRYQDGLRRQDAMDFDDLIFLAIKLLRSFPEVREVFSASFRYILIDEYQDTNKAQYQLVQLLLAPHKNIVVVGDDDQSIYGWRGADIRNILGFREDYPDAKVTKLERNYRSTANILGAANSVIKRNKGRMDKTLWTENPDGDKISVVEVEDEVAEASFVARRIQNDAQFKPGDTAIFYRTNAQSRALEDELRRRQIPYLIVGGIRFYERKEVKDVLAYMRLIANPRDDVSFTRVLNVPRRGIGDKSLDQLQELAQTKGLPLSEALPFAGETGIGTAAVKKMLDFHEMLVEMRARSIDPAVSLSELVAETLARSGYKSALEDDGTDEALDRLANVEELVAAAQDFTDRRDDPAVKAVEEADGAPTGSALEMFLQEISLVSDTDALRQSQDAVTLMTVHSAKGLEFPRVFVTGLEDRLFPLAYDDDADIEEERRLFYVATTRARQQLTLTHARRRRRFGSWEDGVESRFIREIDKKYVEIAEGYSPPRNFGTPNRNVSNPMPNYEDMSQEAGDGLHAGQKVRHMKFGVGKVMKVDGEGEAMRAEVVFGDNIRRVLMMKFAKLERME